MDPDPTVPATPGIAAKVAPHSRAAKAAHWGFLGLFLYALTKQLDEVEELEDLALLQAEMIFAGVFLVLLIARFAFMQSTRPSVLPSTPRRERLLARAVHIAMYAGLALIAITGLGIGYLYESGTKSGSTMNALLLAHEIAVNASYTLIIGHVAAAIYHRRRSDGVWDAMVPVWREPGTRNQPSGTHTERPAKPQREVD